ncbi:type II toxin-antitoxin system VapC family toxin [Oceanibaculum pacificum]|uniref:Twitching motility protein PilT n=1 Tax=Oceanibaculum pacificum TaxID=580166 RepID=A0A154VTQ6_9PROT|nr:type II toxin-antitoxin system VapC family toxin [Oceanibaculum pacificum]KZD04684.1 twitching motility protein PilT [Oceanibaculum pacificum]
MRLLLDTHALLWWLWDDANLPASARALIADPENEILVSAASAWEIATKARLGKLPEAGDIAERLSAYVSQAGFATLEIGLAHAQSAGALPGPHRDPFDRMMIAQSRLESLPVMTRDPVFREYGAECLW